MAICSRCSCFEIIWRFTSAHLILTLLPAWRDKCLLYSTCNSVTACRMASRPSWTDCPTEVNESKTKLSCCKYRCRPLTSRLRECAPPEDKSHQWEALYTVILPTLRQPTKFEHTMSTSVKRRVRPRQLGGKNGSSVMPGITRPAAELSVSYFCTLQFHRHSRDDLALRGPIPTAVTPINIFDLTE